MVRCQFARALSLEVYSHRSRRLLGGGPMTLVSKALVLVLSLTAIACFSGPLTDSSGSSGPRSATGGIGLHVTLQGGQTLTALTYSLSNGDPADTLAGTIPLSTGDAGPG